MEARRNQHEWGVDMRGLKDRTVLVTGGANGIGAAIARRLAEEGCTVGILDMDITAGEDVAGEIKARGHRASFRAVDITDYDAVSRAVESFEASFGPVSFLVNNAGWDRAQNFLDTAPDFWRKVVAINLFGPLNVSHVVLRGMAARGFGRVVNIASDAGRVGSSGEAVYSACKGGIIALTKTLARERLGQCDNPALAGGINRLARGAHAPGIGGDIDDASKAARRHAAQDDVRHVQRAEQVDGDHLAPEIGRGVEEILGAIPAGIVDEKRYRPKGGLEALDRARDRVVIGNIDGAEARPVPARLDLAGDVLSRRDIHIQNADRAALLREAARDCRADAIGAAGHQNGAIL